MFYFTRHLLEAVFLNISRTKKYYQLSRGKSLVVSSLLICTELLTLSSSILLDIIAIYFQRKGIPFLRYEFIEMSKTPIQQIDLVLHEGLSLLPSDELKKWKKKYSISIAKKDIHELFLFLKNDIHFLQVHYPNSMGMVRHVLEAFARAAFLFQAHQVKAKNYGVFDQYILRVINFYFVRSHIWALDFSLKLDSLALPTQQMGVRIILNDVPHIPIEHHY